MHLNATTATELNMPGHALICGQVMHLRTRPEPHRLSMPFRFWQLRLSDLDQTLQNIKGVGTSWASPIRWRREDYLFIDDSREPLLESLQQLLVRHGLTTTLKDALQLTQLRSIGYVFNPVSFYACYDNDNRLFAWVADITNTPWGERMAYVMPIDTTSQHAPRIHWFGGDKTFHVSPFLPMNQFMHWGFAPPVAASEDGKARWHVQMKHVLPKHKEAAASDPASDTPRCPFAYASKIARKKKHKRLQHSGLLATHDPQHQSVNGTQRPRLFEAHFCGQALPLDTAHVWQQALAHPLQPWRVTADIYRHALQLKRKGNPFYNHPSKRPAWQASGSVEHQLDTKIDPALDMQHST